MSGALGSLLMLFLVGCAAESSVVDDDGDTWPLEDDCDDTDPDVHPGATEVCDEAGVDENCDGLVNDDDPRVELLTTSYPDEDGDGFGADGLEHGGCTIPAGNVTEAGDCDDTDAGVSPSAVEDCGSEVDEDCDGRADCVE